MRLTDREQAMLAGAEGAPRQQAMRHLLEVGRFFDAEDLVAISQVHLMADCESLGATGVAWLEQLAAAPADQRRLQVPAVTDPRGADFKAYERIRQDPAVVALERRADAAFRALGFMMTDTCINYQVIMPPLPGEHLAFGDTGASIYANSVQGARTNFEGGPSALAAALTGRVPRYGYHLDRVRRGDRRFVLADPPRDWVEWGALGGLIGRHMGSYWETPVIEGVDARPTADDLKHFGAALASHGSTPLFHMVGVTPEAPDLAAVIDGPPPDPVVLSRADIAGFIAGYAIAPDDRLDVVVFAAPQLSLWEMQTLAGLLDGRRIGATTLIACTAPAVKADADRMGYTAAIEAAGGIVLAGVCFYQMHAREIGAANGWTTLMSNSAKLVNIIGGYGYTPVLATMEHCVDSAVAGTVVPVAGTVVPVAGTVVPVAGTVVPVAGTVVR